jgi:hypothetical protein
MVKRSTVLLGVLAIVLASVGMSWGYTVSLWGTIDSPRQQCGPAGFAPGCPIPPIPGVVWNTPGYSEGIETLKGPVAPSCEAPLIPGAIHAALSAPFKAIGLLAAPLMTGQGALASGACDCDLGEPAYVTAAVPCTSVGAIVAPKGW